MLKARISETQPYCKNEASLYEAIKNGDLSEVDKSLSVLSYDKHFFFKNEISAAATAIKYEKEEIYEFLVSKGVCLGPHERMDEVVGGKDIRIKKKFRDIHRRYFNDPNLKHLINLNASSKLSHEASASDRREHLRLITEAFEDLNSLKFIEPILKVASTATNLKIVFDFRRDSVECLDPAKNRNIMATTYTDEAYIYVGAKGFIEDDELSKEENNDNRSHVLGVLIHELTHFVMQLVYVNDSKPYRSGDLHKLKEFTDIVEDCEVNKRSEPFISSVFDYPLSKHHAELIVRVPHLIALYKDYEDKFIEVSSEFAKLFDFYDDNTLVDLKRDYPLLEAKNEIRELNELCGTLAVLKTSDIEMSQQALNGLDLSSDTADKILLISSNQPQMTMRAIFQRITYDRDFESSYIFVDLKTMKTSKILNLVAKALKLCTKPTLIVDCGSRGKVDEMKNVVKNLNDKQVDRKIVFVSAKNCETLNHFKHEEIEHFWNHLAINFQKKLLRKKIIFQGTEMKLEVLVNDLSLIRSIPFQELLANQKVVIGQKITLENSDKLIERKFLPPSSRKARNSERYDIEHKFVELLYFASKSRAILLSDEPGMGKSTSLKMLTLKLIKKYPSHWITFVDLKQHVEAYSAKNHVEFKNRNDIASFLSQRILKIQSFDSEVFTHLFNCDRVVVLLDGLDEICPSYKKFIFDLMTDIQKLSKNQLWITSRPHLVDEVEKKLKPFTVKLKPFTKANRRDFFEKYFSNNVNLDTKLEEVEKFFKKLSCNVSNPLILRIIVEILDEDQNLKLSEANLFSIYDRFTTKLVDKSLDKGSEAKKDLVKSFGNSNIVDFYQKIAFQTIFSDMNSEKYETDLFEPLQFKHVSTPPLHEIVRVGLMFADGAGNFHFIHQTFAEFYVAKFFVEMIFRPAQFLGSNELVDFFVDRVLNKFSSSFVRILIDSALDNSANMTSLCIRDNKLGIEHFKTLVNDGCFNLIEIIALHLCTSSSKLLFMPLDYGDNLILVAVENQSLTFVKKFFVLLTDLNSHQFKKMFFMRTKIDQNIFHFATRNAHSKVFKYLVQISKNLMSKGELADLLMHQNIKDQTILHCSIYSKFDPKSIFEVLAENLSELQFKALVETTTKDNRNSLHLLCMVSSKSFDALCASMQKALESETLKKLMLQEDIHGCRAFDYAIQNKNKVAYNSIKAFYLDTFDIKTMQEIVLPVEQLKFQLFSGEKLQRFCFFLAELFNGEEKSDLKNFLLAKNNDEETLLMFAVMNYDEKDFEAFCALLKVLVGADRSEILEQKNVHGECAFHLAVKTKNKVFIEVGKLYRESFEEQKLREIILGCDKSWLVDLIHIHSGTLIRDSIIRKRIYHYLEDLFEGSEEIDKFKEFFICFDEHGQTVFNIAASCENHEVFEDLFAFSRKMIAIDVLKNMLFQRDEYGKINLVDAIKSGSNSTFELVKYSYCQVFSLEEMQKMLTLVMDGRNIFAHSIIWSPQNELFLNLCGFLMKVYAYDEEEIQKFFTSFDRTDKTVLMYATKYENISKNYFQILLSFIDKIFNDETIKMLLLQKNKKGKTAFHFSIGNYFEENYKFVEKFYLKTFSLTELKEMISTEVDWENFLNEKDNGRNVEETKRLLAFLEILFVDDKIKLKEFFLKRYRNGTTFIHLVKKKGRRNSNEVQEIISFLKQQLPDDEQIKKIIRDNSNH